MEPSSGDSSEVRAADCNPQVSGSSPLPSTTVPAGTALAAVDKAKLLAFAIKMAAERIGPFKPQTYPQTVVRGDLEFTQTGPGTTTIRSLRPLEMITLDFTIMPDGVIFNNQ